MFRGGRRASRPRPFGSVALPLVALDVLVGLLLFDLAQSHSAGLTAAVAFAATAAVGAALVASAVLAGRSAPVLPRTRVRTAIRDRNRRTAFLAQRDPDAPGRIRARAPGDALPTAVA
ncbi:DUF6412 domain-containing protein [Streptomyces sp. bgisy153]|uniref:DUF6412 domain-containing protein n=1 Tax=Streptomyces sp. bgisy153 TaxID=3413793 RepID=UPI003D75DC1A